MKHLAFQGGNLETLAGITYSVHSVTMDTTDPNKTFEDLSTVLGRGVKNSFRLTVLGNSPVM